MRAFTLEDLHRITRYGPRTAAVYPWVRLIQKLVWQYGEAGALERLNGQMARAAA